MALTRQEATGILNLYRYRVLQLDALYKAGRHGREAGERTIDNPLDEYTESTEREVDRLYWKIVRQMTGEEAHNAPQTE